jgi:hypothetical protein
MALARRCVGFPLCVQTNRTVEGKDLDAWVILFAALFTKPALQLSSVSHRLLFLAASRVAVQY